MNRAQAPMKSYFVRITAFILILLFVFVVFQIPARCEDASVIRQPSSAMPPVVLAQKLTLVGAIELAKRNYPSVKTAMLRAEAAHEAITQAKTAYLPRADLMIDENWATANNITGVLAPQTVVPAITGSVKGDNFHNDGLGGFGFTTGAMVSWQPFDFGLRKANVNVARNTTHQAQAQIAVNELDAMSQAANSFLSVLAAQQVLKAAQAKVDRMNIFVETVKVLAQKQLKPITDQYMAESQLAIARNEQFAAEQNNEVALAALERWTGVDSGKITADAGPLIKQIPQDRFTIANPYLHPQTLLQQSTIDVVRAQKHAIERTYYPQFLFRAPVYGRGSTFQRDHSLNFSQGYYPTKYNYAVSVYVYFPAMDIFMLRSQHRQAEKNELAERSRLNEILVGLKQQDAQARAMIKATTRIAENTPIELKAAQEAAVTTRIRYQCQLANVNDVAQNEQMLTQAQVDYANAQLQVWRALLAKAVAHGDLRPFIEEVSRATAESK